MALYNGAPQDWTFLVPIEHESVTGFQGEYLAAIEEGRPRGVSFERKTLHTIPAGIHPPRNIAADDMVVLRRNGGLLLVSSFTLLLADTLEEMRSPPGKRKVYVNQMYLDLSQQSSHISVVPIIIDPRVWTGPFNDTHLMALLSDTSNSNSSRIARWARKPPLVRAFQALDTYLELETLADISASMAEINLVVEPAWIAGPGMQTIEIVIKP